MLAIPLLFVLFAPYSASWQFNFNSSTLANTSASVAWTREAKDSVEVGFGLRLRQPDVLPSTKTIPYWCQFGGVQETKGTFFVQFYTEGSYIAEAMLLKAFQTTNSSSDILASSDIISVQAANSQAPSAQDVLTLNFVAGKAMQVTSPQMTLTTTSASSTTFGSLTTRSIVPVPGTTLTPSSPPSPSASNNAAVIAGSVCGALGLMAIITGFGIQIYRRKRHRNSTSRRASAEQEHYYTTTPHPFIIQTPSIAVTVESTPTAPRPLNNALTVRQALLRDRAEGLRAQVATLEQNNIEGRLMEENERQWRLISSLERQIRYLTEQQGSSWALGYTDEPPPSYMSGSSSGLS
ncbi:hypothetical protein DFS33DRAFT_1346474 [Desarmillaria ectypa]|nr:hypothetical protein DFS33DRAFT_1346474 [Desarmillaria ectypa]